MKLDSPAQIYAQVDKEVDRILEVLEVSSGDQQVTALQAMLKQLLGAIRQELKERLEQLQAQGEWHTFTMAFYGETNAGKSTVIETLRILLGEENKCDRRRQFRDLQAQHALEPDALEASRLELVDSQLAFDNAAKLAASSEQGLQKQVDGLRAKWQRMQADVDDVRRQAPFWKKWLFRWRPPAEEKARDAARRRLKDLEAELPARTQAIQESVQDAQKRKAQADKCREQQTLALAQLAAFADGEIIGDGRSDFTRDTVSYTFDVDGQRFALLDVPGIEGNEEKVNQQISNALSKAHAVFYITAKAAAPQKGDPGKPGTLEKIKSHLDDQTEVFSVFNKRITNPMQLDRSQLVSDDEEVSLGVLDQQMEAQLGGNYRGHLALSAQPAFWSVADCLVPGTPEYKSRAKFLEKTTPQALLEKAGLANFKDFLAGDFVRDYRRKIHLANFNKAGVLVQRAACGLTELRLEQLEPLQTKLHEDAEAAREQLTIMLAGLKKRLESIVQQEIDRFKSHVRQEMYGRIKGDLDNDDFKRALEDEIKAGQATLSSALPKNLGNAIHVFGKEMQDVIERLQAFVQDLLANHGSFKFHGLENTITLEFKVDNGIKLGALVSAALGVALLLSNPGGWVLATFTVLSLLVTAGKAVWGYFDSDYKKEQQRKTVGDNLQRAASSLSQTSLKSVNDNLELIAVKVQEVINDLDEPAETLAALGLALAKSAALLTQLNTDISHTETFA